MTLKVDKMQENQFMIAQTCFKKGRNKGFKISKKLYIEGERRSRLK